MANRFMWIAWPAFVAACALELLVFAFVDPLQIQWGSTAEALGWSRHAVYSAAFFAFWLVSMCTSALTTLLRLPPADLNGSPG